MWPRSFRDSKPAIHQTYRICEGRQAEREGGPSSFVIQGIRGLKPDTDYEVSFFAKMENVKKLTDKASGFYLRLDFGNGKPAYFPRKPAQLDGSCPWTGFKFSVRTPKDLKADKSYIIFPIPNLPLSLPIFSVFTPR